MHKSITSATANAHMHNLAARVSAEKAVFNFDTDLPRPNLYWCTIRTHDGMRLNAYISAEHTRPAQQKLCNWCADTHGFRPYRSNSTILMRRLKMGDLLENPDAFVQALKFAEARGEYDIVQALHKLPAWIAVECGMSTAAIDCSASEALWARMGAELDKAFEPRVLRA